MFSGGALGITQSGLKVWDSSNWCLPIIAPLNHTKWIERGELKTESASAVISVNHTKWIESNQTAERTCDSDSNLRITQSGLKEVLDVAQILVPQELLNHTKWIERRSKHWVSKRSTHLFSESHKVDWKGVKPRKSREKHRGNRITQSGLKDFIHKRRDRLLRRALNHTKWIESKLNIRNAQECTLKRITQSGLKDE